MFKLFKNLSCGARPQEPVSAREPVSGLDLTTTEAQEDYIRDMMEYLDLLKSPIGLQRYKQGVRREFTQVEPFTGANKIIGLAEPVTLFALSGKEYDMYYAKAQTGEIIYPAAVRLYRKKIDRLTLEDAAILHHKVSEYAKESNDYNIIKEHLAAYFFMKTGKTIPDAATATQDAASAADRRAAQATAAVAADEARVSQLTYTKPDIFAPIKLGEEPNPAWFYG